MCVCVCVIGCCKPTSNIHFLFCLFFKKKIGLKSIDLGERDFGNLTMVESFQNARVQAANKPRAIELLYSPRASAG